MLNTFVTSAVHSRMNRCVRRKTGLPKFTFQWEEQPPPPLPQNSPNNRHWLVATMRTKRIVENYANIKCMREFEANMNATTRATKSSAIWKYDHVNIFVFPIEASPANNSIWIICRRRKRKVLRLICAQKPIVVTIKELLQWSLSFIWIFKFSRSDI